MQEKINNIIANSLTVNNLNIDNKTIKEIINSYKKCLKENIGLIKSANNIDIKNNNGFELDFDVVDRIFDNIEKETIIYGDVKLSIKDKEKNIIYGKQIMNIGNVLIINNGNTYVIIEMILRNILANNTIIFNTRGYMYGTNNIIISLIQSILEIYNISKNLIQLHVSESYDELLSKYANINLVICIGEYSVQQEIIAKSKIPMLLSGYDNYDIYIEDDSNIEFINKIINSNISINVYVKKDIEIDNDNSIIVDDINEAIAKINYNGNGYCASIFTNSTNSASKFIKEVHSKKITVNTSPTIERILDINQKDLTIEKTIIYPNNK